MGEISETAQRAIIISLLCLTFVGVVLSAIVGLILRRIIFKRISKIAEERRKQSGQPDEVKEETENSIGDDEKDVEDGVEMGSVSAKGLVSISQNTSSETGSESKSVSGSKKSESSSETTTQTEKGSNDDNESSESDEKTEDTNSSDTTSDAKTDN